MNLPNLKPQPKPLREDVWIEDPPARRKRRHVPRGADRVKIAGREYVRTSHRTRRTLAVFTPAEHEAPTSPTPPTVVLHIAALGGGTCCGLKEATHITNGPRYSDCAACLAAYSQGAPDAH